MDVIMRGGKEEEKARTQLHLFQWNFFCLLQFGLKAASDNNGWHFVGEMIHLIRRDVSLKGQKHKMEFDLHTCLLFTVAPHSVDTSQLFVLCLIFNVWWSKPDLSRSSNVGVAPVPEPQAWVWQGSDHLPVKKNASKYVTHLPLTHHSSFALLSVSNGELIPFLSSVLSCFELISLLATFLAMTPILWKSQVFPRESCET